MAVGTPVPTGVTPNVTGLALPNAGSNLLSPVDATQDPAGHIMTSGATGAGAVAAVAANPVANPAPSGGQGGAAWNQQLLTRAYDLNLASAYRDVLVFDQFATVRHSSLTHNGAIVRMSAVGELMPEGLDAGDASALALVASARLPEDYDVLPTKGPRVAGIDIAMAEFGRVVTRTKALSGLSMVPFDPVAADRLSRNAMVTMDSLAYATLVTAGGISFADETLGGAGVALSAGKDGFGGTVTGTAAAKPTQNLNAIAQHFQEVGVEPFSNGLYLAVVRPATVTALRLESDAAGWRYFQVNQIPGGGTGDIPRRQIGVYEGFMFITSNRIPAAIGGLYLGSDALAKVYPNVAGFSPGPQAVVAPDSDKLRRFYSLGWYWLGNYSRYKAEAVIQMDIAA